MFKAPAAPHVTMISLPVSAVFCSLPSVSASFARTDGMPPLGT